MLEDGDVFRRIAIDGDDVRPPSRLECANAILPSEQVRRVDRRGLDRRQRRHSQLYIDMELAGVQSVRINRCVRAKRHLHSRGERLLCVLLRSRGNIAHLLPGIFRYVAVFHVLLHVFGQKKCRHEIGSILLQRGDRSIVHQVAVLDGVHGRFRGPAHSFVAVRMGCHAAAEPVRVRDDRFHLFERVLRGVRVVAFRKHSARSTDLDDVRAILDDFANLVLHRLDAVGHSVSLKMK